MFTKKNKPDSSGRNIATNSHKALLEIAGPLSTDIGMAIGLSLTGNRAGCLVSRPSDSFSMAQSKHLPIVVNASEGNLNISGVTTLIARNVQELIDLNLIAFKTAESALLPLLVIHDFDLNTYETVYLPDRKQVEQFLGSPDDKIISVTPAQKLLFGKTRRRIPIGMDLDHPILSGFGKPPFCFEHLPDILAQTFEEYKNLTGRNYNNLNTYKTDDADYLIIGQGSSLLAAEAVADHFRSQKKIKLGVVRITVSCPFPDNLLQPLLKNKKGILVLEKSGCINIQADPVYFAHYEMGDMPLQTSDLVCAVENMLPAGQKKKKVYLSVNAIRQSPLSPKQEIQQQAILDAYPQIKEQTLPGTENPPLLPKGTKTILLHGIYKDGFLQTGVKLTLLLSEIFGNPVKGECQSSPLAVGQSANYHVAVSPEPIKVSLSECPADIVMVLDERPGPSVLNLLKDRGILILPSTATSIIDEKIIHERKLQVFTNDLLNDVKILLGSLLAVFGSKPEKGQDGRWNELMRETLVKKGAQETFSLKEIPAAKPQSSEKAFIPEILKRSAEETIPAYSLHRFWVQSDYKTLNPFTASGILPAGTGYLRDLSSMRNQYPLWLPEKCTACGDCWVVCPDSALPPLLHEPSQIFESMIAHLESTGHSINYLLKELRSLTSNLNQHLSQNPNFKASLELAFSATLDSTKLRGAEKEELARALDWVQDRLKEFPMAVTPDGLLSITLNPNACKGCMECVKECGEKALVATPQTESALGQLRKNFDVWQALPNTDSTRITSDANLLLDKIAYHSMVGGDNAPPGSAEKTALHLFTSVATATMRKRRRTHLARIEDTIERLEKHIKLRMSVNLENPEKLGEVLNTFKGRDLTLSELSNCLNSTKDPLDTDWLSRVSALLSELKKQKAIYSDENNRASLEGIDGLRQNGSWPNLYPYHPYSFPCTLSRFQESPAVALGLFEGTIQNKVEELKVLRITELELEEKYNPKEHQAFFDKFSWKDLTDEEFSLCPPVVVFADSKSEYLHPLLQAKLPIKILLLNTVSLNPTHTLSALSFQNAYILQGGMGNPTHLLQGFSEGLQTKRCALFHVFCSHLPVEGKFTDLATEQARLAISSRAHVTFTFNPEKGALHESLSLDGNPNLSDSWGTQSLEYLDSEGKVQTKEIPFTFADFIYSENLYPNDFQALSGQESDVVPLAEFLTLDSEDQAGRIPFIEYVNEKKIPGRLKVSDRLVEASKECLSQWNTLKTLKRLDIIPIDEALIKETSRFEVIDKITQSLVDLAQGSPNGLADELMKTINLV